MRKRPSFSLTYKIEPLLFVELVRDVTA
jgi:hypothetical protein